MRFMTKWKEHAKTPAISNNRRRLCLYEIMPLVFQSAAQDLPTAPRTTATTCTAGLTRRVTSGHPQLLS